MHTFIAGKLHLNFTVSSARPHSCFTRLERRGNIKYFLKKTYTKSPRRNTHSYHTHTHIDNVKNSAHTQPRLITFTVDFELDFHTKAMLWCVCVSVGRYVCVCVVYAPFNHQFTVHCLSWLLRFALCASFDKSHTVQQTPHTKCRTPMAAWTLTTTTWRCYVTKRCTVSYI